MRRSLLLIIIALPILLFGILVISLPGAQYQSNIPRNSDAIGLENAVGLSVQMQKINTKSSQALLLLTPDAAGAVGQSLPNGAFFVTRVLLNLDVAEGTSLIDIPPGTIAGGEQASIFLSGSEANYPFDRYSTNFFAAVNTPSLQGEDKPPFVLSDPTTQIPGFSIESRQVGFLQGELNSDIVASDRYAGYGYLTWKMTRSPATIFSAMIIISLMIIGALVSLLITITILRRLRPPSLGVLVWLASFLFALFQIRGQLPGSPSAGINLDRFVFFPVILLMVCLVAVNVVLWAARDDWDMVNPLAATQGRISRIGTESSKGTPEDQSFSSKSSEVP